MAVSALRGSKREREEGGRQLDTAIAEKWTHTSQRIAFKIYFHSTPTALLLLSRRKSRRWAGKLTQPRDWKGEGDVVERGCVRYLLLSFNLQFLCVCARSHKSCRNFSHCFVWISGDFPGLQFSLFSLPKVNNNCSNHAGGFIRVGSCLLSILLSICLPN